MPKRTKYRVVHRFISLQEDFRSKDEAEAAISLMLAANGQLRRIDFWVLEFETEPYTMVIILIASAMAVISILWLLHEVSKAWL
jgi:hypothetical protein